MWSWERDWGLAIWRRTLSNVPVWAWAKSVSWGLTSLREKRKAFAVDDGWWVWKRRSRAAMPMIMDGDDDVVESFILGKCKGVDFLEWRW